MVFVRLIRVLGSWVWLPDPCFTVECRGVGTSTVTTCSGEMRTGIAGYDSPHAPMGILLSKQMSTKPLPVPRAGWSTQPTLVRPADRHLTTLPHCPAHPATGQTPSRNRKPPTRGPPGQLQHAHRINAKNHACRYTCVPECDCTAERDRRVVPAGSTGLVGVAIRCAGLTLPGQADAWSSAVRTLQEPIS